MISSICSLNDTNSRLLPLAFWEGEFEPLEDPWLSLDGLPAFSCAVTSTSENWKLSSSICTVVVCDDTVPPAFADAFAAELGAVCESAEVADAASSAAPDAGALLVLDVAAGSPVEPEVAGELVPTSLEPFGEDVGASWLTICARASMSPTIALNAAGLSP